MKIKYNRTGAILTKKAMRSLPNLPLVWVGCMAIATLRGGWLFPQPVSAAVSPFQISQATPRSAQEYCHREREQFERGNSRDARSDFDRLADTDPIS